MRLYNCETQQIEKFTTKQKNKVSLYVCGITPYDTTHMGHAFTYVIFDALVRFLQHQGYSVDYVQNVTDIDDDILKKAKEVDKNWKVLGELWTERFLTDLKTLNVKMPDLYVKATDSIGKIIEMNKFLLKNGNAYENQGNVYFDVKTFPAYGILSHLNNEQMLLISKERGGNPSDVLKKNPLDFLLWQLSAPGEPSWTSPWGKGRPGWHIECSAMINKYLGDQIDIHGGGKDLIFPHHESEIAQSESYTGKKPFVRYWMHTAMVIYEGEKMSKSLGNLILISDLLKLYPPSVIRWYLLSHHYRKPWEYYKEDLQKSQKQFSVIKEALLAKSTGEEILDGSNYLKNFENYLKNDFDTPSALSTLMLLAKKVNSNKQKHDVIKLQALLRDAVQLLGFSV